jgi:ferredoxin-NADP reductase
MEWLDTRILEVVQETPLDRSFLLSVPPGREDLLDFAPGQFLLVMDPSSPEPVRRAYSLASAPREGGAFRLTVRDMGRFGHSFYDFPAGKALRFQPPQGRFLLADDADDLLLAAGGSGVTPFRCFVVARALAGRTTPVTLLQSAKEAGELIFRELFERLDREHEWFRYLPTVTRAGPADPWPGRRGRIDVELLREVVRDPGRTWFYACGPGVFVRGMLDAAQALGVPRERCKKEQWG